MEAIVTRGEHVPGVETRDVKLARDIASQEHVITCHHTVTTNTMFENISNLNSDSIVELKLKFLYSIF